MIAPHVIWALASLGMVGIVVFGALRLAEIVRGNAYRERLERVEKLAALCDARSAAVEQKTAAVETELRSIKTSEGIVGSLASRMRGFNG